jgi:twinkle protein
MKSDHDILQVRSFAELLPAMIEEILSPAEGINLPWWPKVTEYLGGLRPHEVTLLCAPTGAGKTLFLSQVSAQLCGQQVPHFVAPIETGDTDFAKRVFSVLARKNFNNGLAHSVDVVKPEFDRLQSFMVASKLYISKLDNRVDVNDLIATLTYYTQNYGVRVALLDNLNFFLKVTSSQLEKAEMDNAIHEFVMLVKRLPIHVILIVHPKKTDGGRVESEFDIKGSSTAVQEAANVALLNRPKADDVKDQIRRDTDRDLVFKKIRKRGEYVNRKIEFVYRDCRLMEVK